ncbi:hypothetical protein MEQU1_002522 [Malassezia equina]|uniref:Uncharacterized protein n=1 Tax=Malassezia equina TaxID=1381935 RepID=A0AAF0J0U2_9BASI|nr:hypothetical protein MEQU1_002522 [Malassezia equina]
MDPKRVFESRLLDSLVNEIIVDVALEAHAYAKKKKTAHHMSDSDESGSGDASDLEEVVLPQEDGLEETEFNEDEGNGSDANEGELDADELDSEDDASDL